MAVRRIAQPQPEAERPHALGELVAIGITASPCGGCRQWLHEWGFERVAFRREDGSIAEYTPADLLPDTWNLPE